MLADGIIYMVYIHINIYLSICIWWVSSTIFLYVTSTFKRYIKHIYIYICMYVKMKHKQQQTARNNILTKHYRPLKNKTQKILFVWLFFMYVRMVFIIIKPSIESWNSNLIAPITDTFIDLKNIFDILFILINKNRKHIIMITFSALYTLFSNSATFTCVYSVKASSLSTAKKIWLYLLL